MRYIKSDFKGQLPKLYDEGPSGTSLIPSDMNNMNKEEPSRYVRGKERERREMAENNHELFLSV